MGLVTQIEALDATAPERRPRSNLPEYTVSEISGALKRTVEDSFGHVRVRGEISQARFAGSGHLYLRLKDEAAVLDAVCWKSSCARLGLRPEDGLEVVCTGRLTTYPGKSSYQLIIDRMELAGEGALLKLLEDRKRRLAAEGLFDGARKKPLPYLPGVIGIITSPTGAVIRDILHRLEDRFPRHVLLWPVPVQGEGAAELIADAIAGFNAFGIGAPPRPDLLIVARGGGSLEDLMPFNEEIVVRAAAASRIPLISAVGHETDTTLIDHAADHRAPTPTAAAERAVPVRADLLVQVLNAQRRVVACMSRGLERRRSDVQGLSRGLGDPGRLLDGCRQRLDDFAERLANCTRAGLEKRAGRVAELGARLRHPRDQIEDARRHLESSADRLKPFAVLSIERRRERLSALGDRLSVQPIRREAEQGGRALADWSERLGGAYERRLAKAAGDLDRLSGLLESYSYKGVLKRGFALVTDAHDHPVTSVAGAVPGAALMVEFGDGKAGVVVAGERKRPERKQLSASAEQTRLF